MASRGGSLRTRLLARRHTALLIAIVVAFAVRPLIGDHGAAPVAFSVAFMLLMLVALFTIQIDDMRGERSELLAFNRRRRAVGLVLAVLALVLRIALLVAPSRHLTAVASGVWLLFFAYVTWTQFRTLLRQRRITNETLSMAVAVYLLIGLTWGLLYAVILELQPHAFRFGTPEEDAALRADPSEIFPVLIYFSLVTLATIGYGDVDPVTLQARYTAVTEGIVGQFYLAILVARLVSLHMGGGDRPPLEAEPPNR